MELVNQPTNKTARKVQAASGAGAGGSVIGLFVAAYTMQYLPSEFLAMSYASEAWTILVVGFITWLSSFSVGRQVRERLENMLWQDKGV